MMCDELVEQMKQMEIKKEEEYQEQIKECNEQYAQQMEQMNEQYEQQICEL